MNMPLMFDHNGIDGKCTLSLTNIVGVPIRGKCPSSKNVKIEVPLSYINPNVGGALVFCFNLPRGYGQFNSLCTRGPTIHYSCPIGHATVFTRNSPQSSVDGSLVGDCIDINCCY
ncbi:hypothetical protein WR25_23606 [Diploscapter pachys]|uniref:Uncharacterized protein n=1 Tax=Diploscapter pachys TaxID=2018661 RepID=A0A2A2L2F3_9BILA|nr:hypothetical protein WR25_23606 [Diploscapter pachys]